MSHSEQRPDHYSSSVTPSTLLLPTPRVETANHILCSGLRWLRSRQLGFGLDNALEFQVTVEGKIHHQYQDTILQLSPIFAILLTQTCTTMSTTTPRKRRDPPSDSSSTQQTPAAKRTRTKPAQTPTTDATYSQFHGEEDVELSRNEYVGLCMYLSTILRLGFPATTSTLDLFVKHYPAYKNQDPAPARAQSYHTYFQSMITKNPLNPTEIHTVILTEARLRSICRENPFAYTWNAMVAAYLARTVFRRMEYDYWVGVQQEEAEDKAQSDTSD